MTKTATQAITVSKVLTSIEITTPPSRTSYFSGETFSTAGMVVTAHYNDGSKYGGSNRVHLLPHRRPFAGDHGHHRFLFGGRRTKTTTQAITVTVISSTFKQQFVGHHQGGFRRGPGGQLLGRGRHQDHHHQRDRGRHFVLQPVNQCFYFGVQPQRQPGGFQPIHFKIGKIGGTQVGLCDSSYGSSTSTSGKFTMNTSNTNSGGWAGSHMRTTVLGSDTTPTSPRANTLLAALPADLRAVMKPITKYSDNTGGGSNTASYVTSTTDYLPLLSEFEVQGARSYANSAEQNYQQQYAYYQAGNSKVHYKHDATGTAAYAWCRSVYATNTNYFCLVYTNGGAINGSAYISWAVAPALPPNPAEQSEKIPPTEVGGSDRERTERRGGRVRTEKQEINQQGGVRKPGQ